MVWRWVDSYRGREGTAVISTHDLAAAGTHCDVVVVVVGGRIVAFGPPSELAQGVADLAEAYTALTGSPPDAPAPTRERRRRR